jgi:hypothetical protein
MKTSSESGSSSDAKGKQESEFATISGESTIIVKAIAEDKSGSEIGQGVSLSGASSQVKPINTTVLDTVSKAQQGHAVFGNRNDLKFATARRTRWLTKLLMVNVVTSSEKSCTNRLQ